MISVNPKILKIGVLTTCKPPRCPFKKMFGNIKPEKCGNFREYLKTAFLANLGR